MMNWPLSFGPTDDYDVFQVLQALEDGFVCSVVLKLPSRSIGFFGRLDP